GIIATKKLSIYCGLILDETGLPEFDVSSFSESSSSGLRRAESFRGSVSHHLMIANDANHFG
ncbi:MAG: hypothetical protein ACHQX3_00935, partial [Nitrospirales bacterium]